MVSQAEAISRTAQPEARHGTSLWPQTS